MLLASVLALLPLAAFAGLSVVAVYDAHRAAEEQRLRDTARGLASAIDAQLGSYVAALRALATARSLRSPETRDRFEERAREVAAAFGINIVLLGPAPDHPTLLNTIREPTALPAQRPPELAAAIAPALAEVFGAGRPAISNLFPAPVSGGPALAAFIPVMDDDRVIQALGLGFRPDALLTILARQNLPGTGFAAVADGGLRIVAHTLDPEGRRIGVRAPDWVAGAIEGRNGIVVVGPGWRGRDNVYAVERLATNPAWTVTVARPLEDIQAAIRSSLGWGALGAGALAVGLGLVAWMIRREVLLDTQREAAALRAGRADVERLHRGLPAVIFLRNVAPDGSSLPVYRGGDIAGVTGWPPEQLLSLTSWEHLAVPGGPDHRAVEAAALRDGAATVEWQMRRADGQLAWMRSHVIRLSRRPDGGGEIAGYILNVDAERRAAARAIASGRLAALGEMAAGLAHELKQPLAIISLAAQNADSALRRGNLDSIPDRLGRIANQAQRTGEIIEHLRRFALGSDAQGPMQPVLVRQSIEGALALVGQALRDAEISLRVEIQGPPEPVALGQLVPLEQVLVNLLINARDAMLSRAPGTPRRIEIGACHDLWSGRVRITVADTGGGIPEALLGRLFEPFVTTKAADKGSGLGLSICHGIMNGMGGSIEARNEGDGAVFAIDLPAAPTDPAAAPAKPAPSS